jgi:predicted ATPase
MPSILRRTAGTVDPVFVQQVRLEPGADTRRYPFTLPVVRSLLEGNLDLGPGVTFLVGDNGAGKSTLVEALAVALGFNAEGGTQSFRFATRATESSLGDHLIVRWGTCKPKTGFFLRAESFYNVASEVDRLDVTHAYGGRSLHEQSHGESFLALVTHRFGPNGLYLLDEPEAALSPQNCLALVARIADLAGQNCQFVIATHSPIVLAVPGARILQIADGHIEQVEYDDAEPVRLTRGFLADPERYLRHLIA